MKDRRVCLIKSVQDELERRKMKHVQALTCVVKGFLCIKFTSVDTDELKAKVKNLADDYQESLELFAETKTTITYLI